MKLELFFDLKNSKKTFLDGDAVQVVVLATRRQEDAGCGCKQDQIAHYRALVIRDGGKTRKWGDLKGTVRGPVIPLKLIAPTDSPGFKGADVIGMDAFFDNIPLMGAIEKKHDDPSTWGNVQLKWPDPPGVGRTASFAEFDARARSGERLNVVYFGASLMYSANATDPSTTGFRGLMSDYLEQRYPKARFKFHDAAIGGTPSKLGTKRVRAECR